MSTDNTSRDRHVCIGDPSLPSPTPGRMLGPGSWQLFTVLEARLRSGLLHGLRVLSWVAHRVQSSSMIDRLATAVVVETVLSCCRRTYTSVDDDGALKPAWSQPSRQVQCYHALHHRQHGLLLNPTGWKHQSVASTPNQFDCC